jgi:hypothetical protein
VRILLDEHLDIRLHRVFGDDFEAETVAYRGWKGVANGDLLQWAADEYDGFLTIDRGIPHQQNIEALRLRCIVMKAQSDDYEDLAPLIPRVENAFLDMAAGEIRYVEAPA